MVLTLTFHLQNCNVGLCVNECSTIRACQYARACVCDHEVYKCVHVHVCIFACTCVRMFVSHSHTHTHTHTNILKHTHTVYVHVKSG